MGSEISKEEREEREEKLISSTYSNLISFVVNNFLFNIYGILLKSKVCPATEQAEWLKILSVMHVKGWLYYGYEEGEVRVVVGAYRIKEFKDDTKDVLPKKEEGDILYVAFMASTAEDKLLPRKLLTEYLKNNKSIKEVIFYRRNSDQDIKRIDLTSKEEKDVNSVSTRRSEVSEESVRESEPSTADTAGAKS